MVVDVEAAEAVDTFVDAAGPVPVRDVEACSAGERLLDEDVDAPGEVLPPALAAIWRVAICVTPPVASRPPPDRLPRNWGVNNCDAFSAAVTPVKRITRSNRPADAALLRTDGPAVPPVSVDPGNPQYQAASPATAAKPANHPHRLGFAGGGGTRTGPRSFSGGVGCGESGGAGTALLWLVFIDSL